MSVTKTHWRTHTCGELRKEHVGNDVTISGWVHRKRDHGGLLFIDLRDHYGLTQCVLEPDSEHFARLERLRVESVITLTGKVVARSDDTVNRNLPTGAVELRVEGLTVQSEAEELPLAVFGEPDWSEEVRLKHRYIDLRRESLHKRIVLRSKNYRFHPPPPMIEQNFVEYQTPILTASSPEGALAHLSRPLPRIHPWQVLRPAGKAPQQFKQLIMVSGFDRYFQIAPCFRDEDARADRAPGEFYQARHGNELLSIRKGWLFGVIEPVLAGLFPRVCRRPRDQRRGVSAHSLCRKAIRTYGSDKPDLRNPLKNAVRKQSILPGPDSRCLRG